MGKTRTGNKTHYGRHGSTSACGKYLHGNMVSCETIDFIECPNCLKALKERTLQELYPKQEEV